MPKGFLTLDGPRPEYPELCDLSRICVPHPSHRFDRATLPLCIRRQIPPDFALAEAEQYYQHCCEQGQGEAIEPHVLVVGCHGLISNT